MNILFDKLAQAEYLEAITFYELELHELSLRFKNEIIRALRTIEIFSNAGSPINNEIRQYILHKFPYKILYIADPKFIYIIAVAHVHREPNYWVDRPT